MHHLHALHETSDKAESQTEPCNQQNIGKKYSTPQCTTFLLLSYFKTPAIQILSLLFGDYIEKIKQFYIQRCMQASYRSGGQRSPFKRPGNTSASTTQRSPYSGLTGRLSLGSLETGARHQWMLHDNADAAATVMGPWHDTTGA